MSRELFQNQITLIKLASVRHRVGTEVARLIIIYIVNCVYYYRSKKNTIAKIMFNIDKSFLVRDRERKSRGDPRVETHRDGGARGRRDAMLETMGIR